LIPIDSISEKNLGQFVNAMTPMGSRRTFNVPSRLGSTGKKELM